ncbi:PTS system, N-acetylglucosamine-specific IIBC component [Enterococcus sp. DIV0212c]|uniref:PTS transporter subunit EIIC n=1 Tax=Candidatus Enterococcus ikei TaxID=2815326 RepID=A0ABS3H2G9_9ENTE|nr:MULTISPECIES: N-acetylglucosamine-specific PTS transporter subunit IIBC [unclassified Enterococcus]MBO0441717.1 PTS transporter subunit EIIC [Enterococcus sp. DIV0869a]MBO1353476.1 PTS transporter subunit EIIC [Enterococcus sp. DIV0212c]
MKAYMQRMGRSLMLPVAVLPAASLLVGIANWIVGTVGPSAATTFLMNGGLAILDNLALLFAVGLALGMSKDKDGAAALAGLVAYLVPKTVLGTASVQAIMGLSDIADVNPAFNSMGNNVFVGIIAGLTAAAMYNRFSNVKLPMALSFFSGKRLVPIMSAIAMLAISFVLLFIWPVVYNGLVSFGEAISSLGFVGAGLYGFFNRLLIPTGLHHALNSVFWFDVANINDIGNFLAGQQALDSGKAIIGQTGMYQAGFFPVMMFGLPAGAFAIYQCARPEKKKVTASLMLAAGFAAFFTGVTEPLEFSFMFVAWPLYVVHAVLTGLSLAFAAFMQWTAGFAFSAGFVDFFLSLKNPVANHPMMLVVQGLVVAVIYYFAFRFAITKFNLMTPGREEGDGEETPDLDTTGDNKFAVLANKIYQGLGADANVTSIDNCTTRLRLTVKDTSKVDQAKIKATGVPGVKVIDDKNIQVIVGTEVQFVADEMTKLRNGATPVTSGEPVKKPEVKTEAPKATAKDSELYAVANGKVIPISEVQDDVFSAKMMGDGFAVIPTDGEVTTPVAGKITSIFPTKHALGIQTDSGIEVLLHMGLDTVELKGAPFTLHVEEGQVVKQGDKIATIDLAALETAGKKSDLIVVFTNQDVVENYDLTKANQTVSANDLIGKVTVK